jgi:hypothetical protein
MGYIGGSAAISLTASEGPELLHHAVPGLPFLGVALCIDHYSRDHHAAFIATVGGHLMARTPAAATATCSTNAWDDARRRLRLLEVRQVDVVSSGLERGAFDLIHARALLMHLPGRGRGARHADRGSATGWMAAARGD